MNKKRLLFILDHAYGGGAEIITISLATALSHDHHVGLIILDRSKLNVNIPNSITEITVENNSNFINSNFWRMKNFSDEYKQEIQSKIDDFHADLVVISFWNSLHLSKFLNHPNVYYWIHGDIFYQPPSPSFKYILRDFLRKIRQPFFFKALLNGHNIIVVNKDLNNKISKICSESKVITLYNGIQQRSIDQQKNIIWDAIYVGRLSSEKQVHHAIQAFAQSHLTGRMAIVGDGYLKADLLQLTHDLNLQDRVHFLGWLESDQVAHHIHSSRLLILSSQTEGYPLVISEAILLDTPVVAYKCCEGICHQLSNQLASGLVPPQNIKALAQTINHISESSYKITEKDKKNLSLDTMKNQFKKLTGI
ncbi:MAG: glycosyltransferase [Bacilli bacterium]